VLTRQVFNVQNNISTVGLMLLILGATQLVGCANVSVKSAWQDNVSHDQSFTKILIVGVSPEFNQRCAFEWALASQIRSAVTQAFVSCNSMTSEDQLSRENIERVAASVHADAVLATSLVAMELGAQEGGGRDTRGGASYKATDSGYASGYGAYGLPVTYVDFQKSPPIMTMNGEVHVLTKLYATRDASLVYTLNISAKSNDIESTASSIQTIAAPIGDRLRRDKLVR
jgi:hypothetical protein